MNATEIYICIYKFMIFMHILQILKFGDNFRYKNYGRFNKELMSYSRENP